MLSPNQFRMSDRTGCCEPNPNTPERALGLNLLDSRAIGRASCYAQRFMRSGLYPYNVVPGHGQALVTEYPFTIIVDDEKGSEMAQHNVLVRDARKGLDVDQPEVRIKTGGLVLWSGNGATTIPFAVVGEHDFFNSHRLVNESGYSHAFGTAGDYRWRDAHGSDIGGLIRVSDPKGSDAKALAAWRKQLAEGSLVMIADGRVDRPELDIMTGQTVFFAIVTGPGISITDERLLDRNGKVDSKGAQAA